jgi:HK97 gp10 family phage protein
MARKPTARVVLNRSRLDQVTLAVADGMFAVGKAIIETARPPDAPPYGEGLRDQGGVLVYVDGKKVAGFGLDGKQPKPPRAAKVSRGQGIHVIVGWGFPGRFVELGTAKMAAQPFLTPAADEVLARATEIMAPVVKEALP